MEKNDERQQDQSPPPELTPAKRMKLNSNEDIQFGYQDTLYQSQSTVRLSEASLDSQICRVEKQLLSIEDEICQVEKKAEESSGDEKKRLMRKKLQLLRDKKIKLMEKKLLLMRKGLVAKGVDVSNWMAYGARPLKGEAEFEVKITKICGTIMRFDFGVVLVSNKSDPAMSSKNGLPRFWGEVSFNAPNFGHVDFEDLREGDRVGLLLSEDGALEFTVNGESLGIAAENIYTIDTDVYAFVGHYNAVATEITKAGKRAT